MKRPAKLPESLSHRLNSYALAASAAGVGMLALIPASEMLLLAAAGTAGLLASSESAEARIVYTPVHKLLPCTQRTISSCSGTLKLDLHRHRQTDFILRGGGGGGGGGLAIGPRSNTNAIWRTSAWEAARLPYGAVIKSNNHLQPGRAGMFSWDRTSTTFSSGPWAGGTSGYLGLRFFIRGRVHYGWARVTTYADAWKTNKYATLDGYAYETIPNKPIIAGKTKGPDVIPVAPATLGHLARGASVIPTWRK